MLLSFKRPENSGRLPHVIVMSNARAGKFVRRIKKLRETPPGDAMSKVGHDTELPAPSTNMDLLWAILDSVDAYESALLRLPAIDSPNDAPLFAAVEGCTAFDLYHEWQGFGKSCVGNLVRHAAILKNQPDDKSHHFADRLLALAWRIDRDVRCARTAIPKLTGWDVLGAELVEHLVSFSKPCTVRTEAVVSAEEKKAGTHRSVQQRPILVCEKGIKLAQQDGGYSEIHPLSGPELIAVTAIANAWPDRGLVTVKETGVSHGDLRSAKRKVPDLEKYIPGHGRSGRPRISSAGYLAVFPWHEDVIIGPTN